MEPTKSVPRCHNQILPTVWTFSRLIISILVCVFFVYLLSRLCITSVRRELSASRVTVSIPAEKKSGPAFDFVRGLYYVEQGRIDEAQGLFQKIVDNKNAQQLLSDYCRDFLMYLEQMLHFRIDDLHQKKELNSTVTRLFQNCGDIALYLSKYESALAYRYASVIPYFCARNFEQNLHENFRLYEYYFRNIIAPSDALSFQDADMLCLYVREYYHSLSGEKEDARQVLLLVEKYRRKYEGQIGENGEYIKQSVYLTAVERYCTRRLNKIGLWALFNQFPEYWF